MDVTVAPANMRMGSVLDQECRWPEPPPLAGSYVAVAKIFYPEPGAPLGHLLYIKPSYRATEPASVRSYAEANPKFPHEPTTDQMFGESQFEAYRALGEYIMETIDG